MNVRILTVGVLASAISSLLALQPAGVEIRESPSSPSGAASLAAGIQMNLVAEISSPTWTLISSPRGFDFDHDGKREFVIRVQEPGTSIGARLEFYESESNDNFVLAHVLELAEDPNDSADPADAGDIDGDGLADLTVREMDWSPPSNSDHGIRVYESLATDTYPERLVWEDLAPQDGTWWFGGRITDGDNDGKQEIITGQPGGPEFVVYENDGDDSYPQVYAETVGNFGFEQSFGLLDDVDNDSKQEMLLGGGNRLFAFESTGDDLYEQIWSWNFEPVINVQFIVDGGDLDDDGRKEFLAGGLKPNFPLVIHFHLFESVADNEVEIVATFTLPATGQGFYSSATVADVDGDGRREIVLASENKVVILRNIGDNAWQEIWSADGQSDAVGPVQAIGTGDHDGDGKDEIIFRMNGYTAGTTGVWEIDPIYQSDPDHDGTVTVVDNCPQLYNPGQEDADGDAVGDACDNCVYGPNPSQLGFAPFGQELVAADSTTFIWSSPAEFVYVKGDLASVGSYAVRTVEVVPLAMSLSDFSVPASDSGFYYLVRPDCLVGSWQTSIGAEPGRDLALP